MDIQPVLGVIGGSGLYSMEQLTSIEQVQIETPYGEPSSPIVLGDLEGQRVAFLARHGIGHRLSPTEVNYRANIYALKSLGIKRVLAVAACGSLREDYAPGEIVVPDQLFDFTKNRKRSFFEGGIVAHLSVADPFCNSFSEEIVQCVKSAEGIVHDGGPFITIDGPRFSTRAESNTYRAWGMSIIGMTTSPEAFLAREAEMCYSVMAHVTDYDVWRIAEEAVTVEIVIRTLKENTDLAQRSISLLVNSLDHESHCLCHDALQSALITDRDQIPDAAIEKLGILIAKYIS